MIVRVIGIGSAAVLGVAGDLDRNDLAPHLRRTCPLGRPLREQSVQGRLHVHTRRKQASSGLMSSGPAHPLATTPRDHDGPRAREHVTVDYARSPVWHPNYHCGSWNGTADRTGRGAEEGQRHRTPVTFVEQPAGSDAGRPRAGKITGPHPCCWGCNFGCHGKRPCAVARRPWQPV